MYNAMYQGFAANQAQASMASAASTNQIFNNVTNLATGVISS